MLELEAAARPPGPISAESEREPVTLNDLKVRSAHQYFLAADQLSFKADRQLAADVANAVAQSYLTHSYDIRFRSASNLTTFMEKQTDELRAKMERSSGALADFERQLNIVSPEEKTNIVVNRLLQLNTELISAEGDRVQQ